MNAKKDRSEYYKKRYLKDSEAVKARQKEYYRRKKEQESRGNHQFQIPIFENEKCKIIPLKSVKKRIVEGKSENCEINKGSEIQLSIFGNECGIISLGGVKEKVAIKSEWNMQNEQSVEEKKGSSLESEMFVNCVKKNKTTEKVENVGSERETKRNYLLIAIGFLLSFCAIVILQNDSLNFYLGEKSAFTLLSLFSSVDGTSALALLKSSVPEVFMFFIGIAPVRGFRQNLAKWSLVLTISSFSIGSIAMNVFDSSQDLIISLKSSMQKQLAQGEVVATLKAQEKELVEALALANSNNKEGRGANIWVVRSITRKLSETRENFKIEIQKQETAPLDEIQKKIDRVRIKNIMFVLYRIIIFASSLFLMSFLSKLIFSPESFRREILV